MKLKREKNFYKLEKQIGILDAAYIDDRKQCGAHFRLNLVLPGHIARMRTKDKDVILGVPTYVEISNNGKEIDLYPCPDKKYNLVLRYHPQMEEQ